MLPRTLAHTLQTVSTQFPVVLVTGPRQVGKSTLLDMCAQVAGQAPRSYVTLDDLNARALAQSDPELFLQNWPAPANIDEVQYAPGLFSAIKLRVDRQPVNGQYWLTGSQKFQLMRGVTESLAGRVAVLDLLGFSYAEQTLRATLSTPFLPTQTWIEQARQAAAPLGLPALFEHIWLGSFPRLVAQGKSARDVFYRSYVQTYLQRDVMDVLRVSDQAAFHRFLAACAARTGQLLNVAALARDGDIDHKTAQAWLSVLQTSGLVLLLQPYHSNLTKRLVKAPKLYFLDTGLSAYLTRWPDAASLEAGAMSGAMLETWVVAEIVKSYWHHGLEAPLYFYRDTNQQEIDLLIDTGSALHPVEIKKTANPSHQAKKSFPVLAKLGKPVGAGAVLCLVERDVPLSREVTAIPVAYL